jgi:3-oxoacyl-ACP reductase-like protein
MPTRISALLSLTIMLIFAAAMKAAMQPSSPPAQPAPPAPAAPQAPAAPAAAVAKPARPRFDSEKALADLRRQIAGHENEPATKVFMDVEQLTDVTAGRLLEIMDFGFSRSLGTTCVHCHNPTNWASDEKEEKDAARGMIRLVATINDQLLPKIRGLDTDHKLEVNCTTCHRGQIRPALRME